MKQLLKSIPIFLICIPFTNLLSASESQTLDDSIKVKVVIHDETEESSMKELFNELEKLTTELNNISGDIDQPELNNSIYMTDIRPTKKKRFKFSLLTLDVGMNGFIDNTNYQSAAAKQFVRVPDVHRNERIFDIKNGQSRNVNIWPATFNFDMSPSRNQKVYLSIGVPGFQFYSLKYNNSVQFQEGLDPHVIETSENYKKNKLGITYLSIPVSITGQTRITKSKWLTYGAGIIGGYRIASWTNQKTNDAGKLKVKDPFNLNDYQVALTGELGVKGILRLYATYNLTNMWQNSLEQNLFAVGIRFFGI